jgi:hypothetical protein
MTATRPETDPETDRPGATDAPADRWAQAAGMAAAR